MEKYDVGCKSDKLSLTSAKSAKESDEDNQVNFPFESSFKSAAHHTMPYHTNFTCEGRYPNKWFYLGLHPPTPRV